MSEFQREMDSAIRAALVSLQRARAEGDDYLTELRQGELDSLHRLAVDNGLELPAEANPSVIDLREPALAPAQPAF